MRHDKRKSPKRKALFANGGREGRNWPRQNAAHSCHSSARRDGIRKILPVLHSTGRLLNLYDCIFKEASQDGEASQVHGLYVTCATFRFLRHAHVRYKHLYATFTRNTSELFIQNATDGAGHGFSTNKTYGIIWCSRLLLIVTYHE